MTEHLPSFDNPPVVEVAISVQFKRIEAFSNAHLGLFWNSMRNSFPKIADAEPIAPQVERFGEQVLRQPRLPSFRIVPGPSTVRLQLLSDDERSMVQLQNGRLVFNWRRVEQGEYPRWDSVLPQFRNQLASFEQFLAREGLEPLEPNQWEVTYVNHLHRGREWSTSKDWPILLPGLIGATDRVASGSPESLTCNFRFVLPEKRGRLHIELFHGFAGHEQDADEILLLQLTARGGLPTENASELFEGLEVGHSAIVRTFTEVTGITAHELWRRQR